MPTFIHGKTSKVYLDEFDLSGYFNAADRGRNGFRVNLENLFTGTSRWHRFFVRDVVG